MSAKGDYFPANVNMFVPNLEYAADVTLNGKLTVDLTPTAPAAASATLLVNAQSIAVAGSVIPSAAVQTEANMGKFGRVVQVVASGAATSKVYVHGQDYLGQPMSEELTLNGTTPVIGGKAFRRITKIAFDATAATTINVGTADKFGLPYALLDAAVDFTDGVKSGTQGTYTVPGLTAQTATSGDPRGLFAPHTSVAPNGSRKFMLQYEPRRGQLYGVKHFFNG